MTPFDLLAAAAANPGFDVETATRAYLDTLQGAARAKSDAYFEGGYWLGLWGTVIGVLVDWLLLRFRVTHAVRAFAERRSQRRAFAVWLTALAYLALSTAITLPWAIYTGFLRERQYDLMNQGFGGWLGELAISFALSLVFVPLLIMAVYAVIRRAPRTWWLWATAVVGAFAFAAMVVSPVYIAPLFNTYTEMEAGPLRSKIEAVAAKYDIPADHIYVSDASKQTKRISANVSGLGPTIRITLNDNLLNRTSEPEILAVMGHEMGHYVLGHGFRNVAWLLVVFGVCFFLVSVIAPRLIARYGERWGVRELADPASLPVLSAVFSVCALLATPAINTLIRTAESEADAFGLEAAREPDGFASTAMRLSEYRKIEPGPVEEFLFFDHPSGETRVRMAMQWKKDNVPGAEVVRPPAGYLDR
ncbi:M48 family metallopeptidase [Tsuneonella sp. YG55]|uniref:M48 family metallopeptidase n=1 Tax=Tsuneonella litorea TaxID=2976475 RepID=A0A9X3A746_9SPHN|nr:M48 family metallopeptidase [Tsuneonella litorea]MCT2557971.1 M48 family metallopeptidase [Tsuneonella litorea]